MFNLTSNQRNANVEAIKDKNILPVNLAKIKNMLSDRKIGTSLVQLFSKGNLGVVFKNVHSVFTYLS